MGMEQMRDDADAVKAVEKLKRKAKEDLEAFQKDDDPEEVKSIEDLKRR